MANVPETASFDAGIYQIETTDPVLGGVNGIANAQAKGLANRTAFLKQQIDQLNSGQFAPSWIASQAYVQGELQKLDAKQSVRAATVANITLSGAQTIDGVTLTVGDRVLVKDQTTAAQNGIYAVSATAWSRAVDADSGEKITSGCRIYVEDGIKNGTHRFILTTKNPISVGTTQLSFTDEANSLLATSGYQRIMGGIIIQWGTVATDSTGILNVTFPMAFPNAVFGVFPGETTSGNLGGNIWATQNQKQSGFTAIVKNTAGSAVADGCYYFAIGF